MHQATMSLTESRAASPAPRTRENEKKRPRENNDDDDGNESDYYLDHTDRSRSPILKSRKSEKIERLRTTIAELRADNSAIRYERDQLRIEKKVLQDQIFQLFEKALARENN